MRPARRVTATGQLQIVRVPAFGPMMCAPRILSVLESVMIFTMPSVSSTLRARLLAMKENLPTCTKPRTRYVCVWWEGAGSVQAIGRAFAKAGRQQQEVRTAARRRAAVCSTTAAERPASRAHLVVHTLRLDLLLRLANRSHLWVRVHDGWHRVVVDVATAARQQLHTGHAIFLGLRSRSAKGVGQRAGYEGQPDICSAGCAPCVPASGPGSRRQWRKCPGQRTGSGRPPRCSRGRP